eukprot:TRINITY_DN2148_c1_g1_i11.p1 TRINITY_DN2148_c1_g1~~TRINITY_DN2148_c1_g1_i11.p1  ORF type:complete len:302 (-),score=73.27 TRINITY_DN2148_c1_g1_i11:83-988(-)
MCFLRKQVNNEEERRHSEIQKYLKEEEKTMCWPLSNQREDVQTILAAEETYTFTTPVAQAMFNIFKSEEAKRLLYRVADYLSVPGGTNGLLYFSERALKYVPDDYEPDQEEVLRMRVKTTGIVETRLKSKGHNWVIVDVGGQRNERKKWANCFVGVDAIIFLMALDEYDRALEEDERENRLIESLKLWKRITSMEQFSNSPFVLFMNKRDIFEEKIKIFPLQEIFDDYQQFLSRSPSISSSSELERGIFYIKNQFQKHYAGKKEFRAFDTCALETGNCVRVFEVVRDDLLAMAYSKSGFAQ